MMDKITATKTRLESKVQFLISELPLPSGEVAPTARVRAHASSSILASALLLRLSLSGRGRRASSRGAGEGPNSWTPFRAFPGHQRAQVCLLQFRKLRDVQRGTSP